MTLTASNDLPTRILVFDLILCNTQINIKLLHVQIKNICSKNVSLWSTNDAQCQQILASNVIGQGKVSSKSNHHNSNSYRITSVSDQ